MAEQCDIFISSSRKDNALAQDLFDRLERSGLKCFLARKCIGTSENWKNEIHDAMNSSKIVIILITQNSIKSKWFIAEVGAAWGLNKRIVPLVNGVKKKKLDALFDLLQDIQFKKIDSCRKIEEAVDEIVKMVDFTSFWDFFLGNKKPKEKIYAVLSAKIGIEYLNGKPTGARGHTVLVSYDECMTALRLLKNLGQIRDKLEIVHGGVIIDPDKNDVKKCIFQEEGTVIILGSPHANDFCKRIMLHSKMDLPYKFGVRERKNQDKEEKCVKEEKFIISEVCGQVVRSYPDENTSSQYPEAPGKLDEDYGVLARFANPFDNKSENKVLILAGNHGLGTAAAIEYVLTTKYIEELRGHVGDKDFEALFKANLKHNESPKLEFIEISILGRTNEGILKGRLPIPFEDGKPIFPADR